MFQVIIKTNYNGQEEKEAIDNVASISAASIDNVAINFKDNDGRNKTQFIKLDGYTELILR